MAVNQKIPVRGKRKSESVHDARRSHLRSFLLPLLVLPLTFPLGQEQHTSQQQTNHTAVGGKNASSQRKVLDPKRSRTNFEIAPTPPKTDMAMACLSGSGKVQTMSRRAAGIVIDAL